MRIDVWGFEGVRARALVCVNFIAEHWSASKNLFGLGRAGGSGTALLHASTRLHSIQLRQTEGRPGLPCSFGGVFSNCFSCAFALVFVVASVCVCVCVCACARACVIRKRTQLPVA